MRTARGGDNSSLVKTVCDNVSDTSRPVSRVLSMAHAAPLDDHSSGMYVTAHLMRPTRAAFRKTRTGPPSLARLLPLFSLAPGGVCRAASVTGRAVRSYRTLSPLPSPVAGREAVCFLWHFPWSRLRRTLSGTVSPWSPDFPHNAPGPRRDR